MLLQQITVLSICVFILSSSTYAVVNNGKSVASSDTSNSNLNSNSNAPSVISSDSVSASSEKEANRRELPAGGVSDSYGVPLLGQSYGVPFDTYGPPVPSNPGLPVPVYGVPDGPTKNIVYPAPPPDIPPPLPSLPSLPIAQTYGPPKPIYGPPKPVYGPPKSVYGPPLKLNPPTYHKPQFHKPIFPPSFGHNSFKIPKPIYGPPAPIFVPKPQYGPPKPIYGPPKIPKPFYGAPLKLNYIPPSSDFLSAKPPHGPIKLTGAFGGSLATYGPPHATSLLPTYGPPQSGPVFSPSKAIYGPPKEILHNSLPPPSPIPIYGPPEPVPHGPPHPGAPAPPTPPDIKYDGWQPILGLVSHPPSNVYGAPQQNGHGNGLGLTPPVANDISLTYASSFAHGTGGVNGISHSLQSPSDSYGAPLNTVTGSGGVVSSSGNDHASFGHGSFGNLFGGQDTSLSVIKSIGYELFPSNGNIGVQTPVDSYGAPPLDSFSPDGPYPAALNQNKDSFKSFGSTGLGLLPPSGIYGVPPGGQYGAPLLSPPKNIGVPSGSYGPPSQLNALEINPPKSPVVFREPVPVGLLTSIGESVAQKDAHGIEHSQTKFHGQAYIPPPVPDITKYKDISGPAINPPSNLYSLPNAGSPTSFQSVVHGSNTNDLGDFGSSSFNLGANHNSGSTLTSYTAPLGVVDSSYGIPLQPQALSAGFDQSFDLGKPNFGGSFQSSYSLPQISLQSTIPLPGHDCSQHKSQPLTSYGLPSGSASSYSTSISSLNTNIGQANYQLPAFNFVNTDLQTVHSLSNPIPVHSELQSNSVDIQGKSLGQEYFGKDAEFQQSQEIHIPNGVKDIPIQGNLGSYTLQIQSANGLNGQTNDNIPHEQVLSEGLLQSILSAIEQQPEHLPQVHHPQQNIQGYGDLQHESSGPEPSYQQHQNSQTSDGEAQHSVTSQVVINPPAPEQGNSTPNPIETSSQISVAEAEQSLPLIDNNEIALYFNNSNENKDIQQQVPPSQNGVSDLSEEVRNGQQYGTFVSFKTPHSSYVYGELKTNNGTQSAVEQTR